MKQEIKEGSYVSGRVDNTLTIEGRVIKDGDSLVVKEKDSGMTISLSKLKEAQVLEDIETQVNLSLRDWIVEQRNLAHVNCLEAEKQTYNNVLVYMERLAAALTPKQGEQNFTLEQVTKAFEILDGVSYAAACNLSKGLDAPTKAQRIEAVVKYLNEAAAPPNPSTPSIDKTELSS